MYEAKQYEDGSWAVVECGDTLGNWTFDTEEEAQAKADELNAGTE